MELLLNRKLLLLLIISIILTIGIVILIVPNPLPKNNGDNGKLPKVIVGGKVVQEGVKKGIKYFFKKPLSKRHVIQKITTKSRAKKTTTVVDGKRVNIAKDVDDINTGLAKRLPDNKFELSNGNIYQAKSIKEGANIFPYSGNGIYRLNANEFKILQNYNSSGGLTPRFYQWFNPQIKNGALITADLEKVLKIIPK